MRLYVKKQRFINACLLFLCLIFDLYHLHSYLQYCQSLSLFNENNVTFELSRHAELLHCPKVFEKELSYRSFNFCSQYDRLGCFISRISESLIFETGLA